MKYEVKFTSQFKRDLKLARKQGKDIDKLFDVISTLAEGRKLDKKYRDHNMALMSMTMAVIAEGRDRLRILFAGKGLIIKWIWTTN